MLRCVQGVSENIMLGQLCPVGTGAFSLLLDEKKLADAHDLDLSAFDPEGYTMLGMTPGRTPGGSLWSVCLHVIALPSTCICVYGLGPFAACASGCVKQGGCPVPASKGVPAWRACHPQPCRPASPASSSPKMGSLQPMHWANPGCLPVCHRAVAGDDSHAHVSLPAGQPAGGHVSLQRHHVLAYDRRHPVLAGIWRWRRLQVRRGWTGRACHFFVNTLECVVLALWPWHVRLCSL